MSTSDHSSAGDSTPWAGNRTTSALTEIWRRRVIALFLDKGLLNSDFARKILAWQHSGFSIESGTRILDQPRREALCQYLVRAPLSLQRIRWDEQQDTVTWSASPSGYFKGKIRRYGLYSSRGRGTWKSHPALRSHAPANWYGRNATSDPALPDAPKDRELDVLCSRKTWARQLAKVHDLDLLACPRCGNRMSVIAVITDAAQIRKATRAAIGIIACLDRHGRGPPPLGRSSPPPRA